VDQISIRRKKGSFILEIDKLKIADFFKKFLLAEFGNTFWLREEL
jgi:hypothetical protein